VASQAKPLLVCRGRFRVLAHVLSEAPMFPGDEGISDAANVIRLLSEASVRLTPSIRVPRFSAHEC
jgi:hypothetical protein